jgi:phosphopantothenoylcysteine decarboxylase/phosphopantothenate--cysteine ligase
MTAPSPRDPAPGRLLITAGPTHEPIDEVRYLANRSSGRLGIALAAAAADRAMPTTLLLGPTALPPPDRTSLTVERFRTTASLAEALERWWPTSDVLIMAAAVADYRPAGPPAKGKLSRGEPIDLPLEPTPDLLAHLASTARPDQTLIGFALEPPEGLLEAAREKLRRKGVDAIVANPLETMDAETISATVLLRDGSDLTAPADLSKEAFAGWLLDRLEAMRAAGRPAPRTG